mgnify:CR=1 FL=1
MIPLAQPGKLPDVYPLCRGHTSAVLDTAFSPFDDRVVVSGGDDAHVSVWNVAPEDIRGCLEAAKVSGSMDDIKPRATFLGGKRRVGHVEFHPTAAHVVAAATGDHAIKLFDIEKQAPRVELHGFGDAIQSMAFDQTGSTIVATCRDRKLRMFDVRAPDAVQVTDGHGGIKGARAIWCGDKPRIITTGFSKMSERQMFLWDVTQLTKPIKTVSLDSSNGIIMPFWSDNNIVFLAGKGDGNIRYYELESDELHYLAEYKSIEPQSGMAFLPRRALNVDDNEIARAYKVSPPTIHPVSFYVPRKSEAFQADIFPPARSAEPSLTADEFFVDKKTLTPHLYHFETRTIIKGESATPLSTHAKEASQEAPQEATKEAPRDAPKESPKESPKEAPQEAKDTSTEAAQASNGAPTDPPTDASHEAPDEAPKDDPKTSAPETSKEDPKESPSDAPHEARNEAPKKVAETTAPEAPAAPTPVPAAPAHETQDSLPAAPQAAKGAPTTESSPSGIEAEDIASLRSQVQDLLAQVAERDTHIRELEMENIKLRANQQRVRDVLLTST